MGRAICLGLVAMVAGCDPGPPDRTTYVTTWSAAIEEVVREEATTGDPGIDPLASPTPAHHAKLAAALAGARASAGISDAQWEAAILAHEEAARDEIRRLAGATVQGWAAVATKPADSVAEVLYQSLRTSFAAGWNPEPELVKLFSTVAADLNYERGDGGRWETFVDLLGRDEDGTKTKLEPERDAITESLEQCARELLTAVPARSLADARSDARLSDAMWDYAVSRWSTLPPVPDTLDGINVELREAARDRVKHQRDLADHLSGWAFAGTDEGRAAYVAHTRAAVRTAVEGQLLPLVADAPLRPLPEGDAMVARVIEDVEKTLATDAEGDDIEFRMLQWRHGEGAKSGVAAFVREQIAAARAAVERPAADLVAIAKEAVTHVPSDVTERFERRKRALTDGVAKAATARSIPAAEHDYLRLRLKSDPRPRDAFDAALEGR